MDTAEFYIVEFSSKQNQMHFEPVSSWTHKQLAALFNTGKPRGDGSWLVVGVVPAAEAGSYAEAFFERYHREAARRKRQGAEEVERDKTD